jgi:hypothetical protein
MPLWGKKKQLQSSVLVGLSPIGELLMRLRRLYGRHALFWADSLHADCIVVLWYLKKKI